MVVIDQCCPGHVGDGHAHRHEHEHQAQLWHDHADGSADQHRGGRGAT
jgi:hypothetical protein